MENKLEENAENKKLRREAFSHFSHYTYELGRKIKFYPNLFIYGTYYNTLTLRFTSAHFSHIHSAKVRRQASECEEWHEKATHNLIYLIKEMELGNINFALYVDKSFLLLEATEIYSQPYVVPRKLPGNETLRHDKRQLIKERFNENWIIIKFQLN